jgi:exonuclease III
MLARVTELEAFLERTTKQEIDIKFGTWDVRSLYRAGSLKTVANELAKHDLDLVTVQEVRCDEGGSQPTDDYKFVYGNGNTNHHLGTVFFYTLGNNTVR